MIRELFLVEIEAAGVGSLAELNDRFSAWAEGVANTRVHAGTKQAPIGRFSFRGAPLAADPVLMADAFRWSVAFSVPPARLFLVHGTEKGSSPQAEPAQHRSECGWSPRWPRALYSAAAAAVIAAAADGRTIVVDACAKKAVSDLTRN